MAVNGNIGGFSSVPQTQQESLVSSLASLFLQSRQPQTQQQHVSFGGFSSSRSTTTTTSTSGESSAMQIDSEVLVAVEQERGNDDRREREKEKGKAKDGQGIVEEAKRIDDIVKEYNLDGLSCAICMEPWKSEGDHQVSCLPCGHVYGFSCISRWLQRPVSDTKCPQCNALCKLKHIRKLYTSPVVVVDEELHKKIASLEDQIGSIKTEKADLLDIQHNLLNIQDNLLKELWKLKEKPVCIDNSSFTEMRAEPFQFVAKDAQGAQFGFSSSSNFWGQQHLHCNFTLQHEVAIEGARLFSMDLSYQNLILTRRITGMGGMHMLSKINLIDSNEVEDIQLPPNTKAVKDIQISPCGKLTLLASLGKKLSILSMESNDVVIAYKLKVPAWSCSWDLNSPHYVYTGLQNGMLLVFDLRHTLHPLQSMAGLTPRPIHTIYSLAHNHCPNTGKLLTASRFGPCMWNADAGERPFLVPGFEDKGICSSLAYGPSNYDIVASYHPGFKETNANVDSESIRPDLSLIPGQATLGSQILVKRLPGRYHQKVVSTSAYLSDGQMERSAIINMENCFPLFAYGDKATHGLRLKELPSLKVTQNLKPHHHPILDVKYAHDRGTGILGCVSEDKLQIFSAELLQKR